VDGGDRRSLGQRQDRAARRARESRPWSRRDREVGLRQPTAVPVGRTPARRDDRSRCQEFTSRCSRGVYPPGKSSLRGGKPRAYVRRRGPCHSMCRRRGTAYGRSGRHRVRRRSGAARALGMVAIQTPRPRIRRTRNHKSPIRASPDPDRMPNLPHPAARIGDRARARRHERPRSNPGQSIRSTRQQPEVVLPRPLRPVRRAMPANHPQYPKMRIENTANTRAGSDFGCVFNPHFRILTSGAPRTSAPIPRRGARQTFGSSWLPQSSPDPARAPPPHSPIRGRP